MLNNHASSLFCVLLLSVSTCLYGYGCLIFPSSLLSEFEDCVPAVCTDTTTVAVSVCEGSVSYVPFSLLVMFKKKQKTKPIKSHFGMHHTVYLAQTFPTIHLCAMKYYSPRNP